MEIQELLLESGATRAGQNHLQQPQSSTKDAESSNTATQAQSSKTRCKIWILLSSFWGGYVAPEPSWFKEVRGHLLTVATLTATTAYQSGLSPPGGVWQQYIKEHWGENCPSDQKDYFTPDEAISADLKRYLLLVLPNLQLVFFHSINMCNHSCLSGLLTRNKPFFCILILFVYLAFITMSFAYFHTIEVTAPREKEMKAWLKIILRSFLLLGVSCLCFELLHISQFLVWLGKKCRKLCFKKQPPTEEPTKIL
ncbi:hypothetical protein NMG60_11035298 [Bertholletia excelsa]